MRWVLLVLLLTSVSACDGNFFDPPDGFESSPAPGTPASQGGSTSGTAASLSQEGNLRAGATRTREARVYRSTFSFTTTVTNGAEVKSDTFLAYEAVRQGDNTQVTYLGGAFNEILGGGTRIEVINAGQKTYIRGATLFGATEPDKWYVFPDSRMTDLPLEASDIAQLIDEDYSRARAGAVVSLDSLTCVIWSSEFKDNAGNLLEWLIGKGVSGEAHKVQSAEARYTLCGDGYIHQMEWDVSAHSADDPAQRTGVTVRARQFAFGAKDSDITAPQGAIEIR